ncbi:hypothetical protein EMPS_08605 [Entomortierella parvispora]|uniref:Uncharacterized protein n=1 Tax=Entomortierella parvispora TaxID=205924 RepID=A0A9P3HGN5_9FUNG|nr:hypothetical protein EMPS_08605 [Entomortierella parvispora]
MDGIPAEEEYQSFRIGQDGPVIRIEALIDDETGQRVIYWEDIEFQFPGIHCVRHEDIAISFARDSKKRRIEPWCIRCYPGVVLEVVLKDPTQQTALQHLYDPRPLTPIPGQSLNASVSFLSIHSPSMLSPPSTLLQTSPEQAAISADVAIPPSAATSEESRAGAGAAVGLEVTPEPTPPIPLAPPALAPRPAWVPMQDIAVISGSVDVLDTPSESNEETSQDQYMASFADLSMGIVSTTSVTYSAQESHGHSEGGPEKSHQLLQPQQRHLLEAIQTDSSHHAATIHQAIQDSLHTIQEDLYRNEALQREVLDRQETAAEVQQRILRIQEQSLDRLAMIQSQVRAVLTQTYELHEYPIPRLFIVLPVVADQRRRDRLWKPFSESFKLYFLCECGEHTRGEEYSSNGGSAEDEIDTGVDSWTPMQRFRTQKRQQQQRHHHTISEPGISSSTSTLSSSSFRSSTTMTSFSSSSTSSSTATVSKDSQQSNDSYTIHGHRVVSPRVTQSHHIHLAKHEGYDLERPTEFFQKYGPHILTLLQMLKYGVMAAEIVVPPLAHWKVTEGIEKVEQGLNFATSQLEPKVDVAIQYLEALATVGFDGTRLDSDTEGIVDRATIQSRAGKEWQHQRENQVHALEALEGADLRHLSTFLRNKDESKVLGNLYRIVTAQGHVKWVCLDHFRSTYRESWTRPFRDLVLNQNGGQFDEIRGFVRIRLLSSTVARQFYEALERARFIHELMLALDWETTLEDLRMLRDALQKTNVLSLRLDLCQSQGPARDLLNRNRRFDPILQIMANTRVQSLTLERCDFFWSRLSKSALPTSLPSSSPLPPTMAESPTSPGGPGPLIPGLPGSIQLRSLFIQGSTLSDSWKQDQIRTEDLVRRCQRLTVLGLQCLNIDAMFDLVHRATMGFRQIRLEALYLSVNEPVSTPSPSSSTSASSTFSSSSLPSSAQTASSPSRPKYEHQQEQVDILIRQPQAEISSVIIASNKRPYTDFVYSSQLQKLTLCHEVDLASQESQLRSIFQKSRHSLVEFGAQCRVEELSRVFEIIQESVEPCAFCSTARRHQHDQQPLHGHEHELEGDEERKKKHRQHHRQFPYLHVELKDTGGRNSMVSARVQDPRATVLELTGADSFGREAIFRSFGWAVKKIPPGFKFSKEILKALEQGILTRKNPLRTIVPECVGGSLDIVSSRLQSLHADITSLDEKSMDSLAKVIGLTAATLEKLDIIVLREQQPPQSASTTTGKVKDPAAAKAAAATAFAGSQNALIARFILRVSAQITRLQISAFGLSGLMMDLTAATTQRIAAVTVAAAIAPGGDGGGAGEDRLDVDSTWTPPKSSDESNEKFITFAMGTKTRDTMGGIVSSTAGLGRSPSVSFPLNPPHRSPSSIPRSISHDVRSGSFPPTTFTAGSIGNSVTSGRSSSAPPLGSVPSLVTSASEAVVSMPRLRELVIGNRADPSPVSLNNKGQASTTIHCPMQESYLQWLLIPLSSPRLESVYLGYLDFMKDAWSAVLWTLFQPRPPSQQQQPPTIEITTAVGSTNHKLRKLVLVGTNLSDGQVKVLLNCFDNLAALTSPSSLHTKEKVTEDGTAAAADTPTTSGLALKEIKIEGSLVTRPVLMALETHVKNLVPSCHVILV